jgi:hypothetical protein
MKLFLVFTLLFSAVSSVGARELLSPAPPSVHGDVASGPSALLGRAFGAASKLPEVPHLKTRGRLQEDLVEALLEAGGPVALAQEWTGRISNWRGALGAAAISVHLAREGEEQAAKAALEAAQGLEAALTDPSEQGWRRNRVRARIALAYAILGDKATAAAIQARMDATEGGMLSVYAASILDPELIEAQAEQLFELAAAGTSDEARFALEAVSVFYGRVHGDEELREKLYAGLIEHWKQVPLVPRVELLDLFARGDVENGAPVLAQAKINRIEEMVRTNKVLLEDQVALRARVALLRGLAGQGEAGVAMADEALAKYDEVRESINSIWRGRALRPLAEAYASLGQRMIASDLYERALAEAVVNPNSRPRVEDLVKISISITRSGIEPTRSLEQALERVANGVGEPW